jgi:8-oxo-dGTP pyrophosphatase MutT (NUDIX family)/phosphohistidine phosphatase SixA
VSSSRRQAPSRAAGAVVWRIEGTELKIVLVHRPRYDDWTLPKGKLRAGEQPLLAAVREVLEETGSDVAVGRRLAPSEYRVGDMTKSVMYWAMRHRDGEHAPSEEVDELRWLTVAEAVRTLTYPADRGVVGDFARIPAATSTILLMRHAKAGKRSDYHGEDRLRPLDKIGRRQARASVPLLSVFKPVRALAADRLRCEQTLLPLAEQLNLTIVSAPEFSDEAYAMDPSRAVKSLMRLAEDDGATVICSQGNAIPGLLADVAAPGAPYSCRKGSVWVLSVAAGVVVAADYYPHPSR